MNGRSNVAIVTEQEAKIMVITKYAYIVKKRFVSGLLEGTEVTEMTNVLFTEGRRYGDYIIVSVERI